MADGNLSDNRSFRYLRPTLWLLGDALNPGKRSRPLAVPWAVLSELGRDRFELGGGLHLLEEPVGTTERCIA